MNDLDMKREIRKLAIAYGKPEHPEDETVGLWRHVLEGISDGAVTEAVSRYVRSPARFFPRAGQIADIAREIESTRFGDRPATEPKPLDAPCPVCGAVLQLARSTHDSGEVWGRITVTRADGSVHHTTGWRPRTENDPEPPLRYRVLHDGWIHKAKGVPAVGEIAWPASTAPRKATPSGRSEPAAQPAERR